MLTLIPLLIAKSYLYNGELEESLQNWDGSGGNLDTYLEAQGIVPDDNTKLLSERIDALEEGEGN